MIYKDAIIGSVNIVDIKNKKESLGLYFAKSSNPLINSIATLIFLEKIFCLLNIDVLHAEVLETNKVALEFDKGLGFEKIGSKKEGKKIYRVLELTQQMKKSAQHNKLSILYKKIQTLKYSFKEL